MAAFTSLFSASGSLFLGFRVLFVLLVRHEVVENLLRALETQVSAAAHEDWSQCPWRNPGKQQGDGQNDDNLVDQGALGDAPNHWQLARRGDSRDVLGGYCGVVHDHARRLHGGLTGKGCYVVNAGSSGAGDECDVVKQCKKSTSHRCYASFIWRVIYLSILYAPIQPESG